MTQRNVPKAQQSWPAFIWGIMRAHLGFSIFTLLLNTVASIVGGFSISIALPLIFAAFASSSQTDLLNIPGPARWLVTAFQPFLTATGGGGLIVLGVAILMLKNILQFFSTRVGFSCTKKLTLSIRNQALDQLGRLDLSWHQKNPPGAAVHLLGGGGEFQKLTLVLRAGVKIFVFATTGCIMWASLFLISSRFAALAILFCLILLPINRYLAKASRNLGRVLSESSGHYTGRLSEVLQGIRMVKGSGMEEAEMAKLKGFLAHRENTDSKFHSYLTAITPINESLAMAFILGIALLFRSSSFGAVPMNAGLVVTFFFILNKMIPIFSGLSSSYMEIVSNEKCKDTLVNFLEYSRKPIMLNGKQTFETLRESISLQNVTFRYAGREDDALRGISLQIPVGKYVAIVGPSGSGKSTLVDLIMRFYDPNSGAICLDGRNLKDFDFRSLRKRIGNVSQDTFFFNASIRYNLLYGQDSELSESDLRLALVHSNSLDFVTKLPQGLDTIIGDKGVLLSGGQRQRLAIARAILGNPSILIFDEATSSLDANAESEVLSAIQKVAMQRTCLVIAHRLSAIRDADYVFVIEDGRLVEQGSLDHLLQANGAFAALYRKQASGPKAA